MAKIAVAADHPAASSYGDPGRRSILDIWEQPDDARAMIDQLAASEWGEYIDPGRVAVVGFSFGGVSAMLLASARLDFAKVAEFCMTHQDGACTGLAPHFA